MTWLEEQLRETLRHSPPASAESALAEQILRGVRRRRTRRRRAVAGAGAAVVIGTVGLAGSVLVDRTPVETTTPANSSQCGGVAVEALGAGTGGGATRDLVVLLTNTTPDTSCRVSPDLAVDLLVGDRRLDVQQRPPVRNRGTLNLTHGQMLAVQLIWENWCGEDIQAARVNLQLPGHDVTTEPFQPSPQCRDAAEPSLVRVFQAFPTEVSTAPSAPPERSSLTPSPPPSTPPPS